MKRSRTKPRKDKVVFRATSKKTKVINVAPITQRGGTRL